MSRTRILWPQQIAHSTLIFINPLSLWSFQKPFSPRTHFTPGTSSSFWIAPRRGKFTSGSVWFLKMSAFLQRLLTVSCCCRGIFSTDSFQSNFAKPWFTCLWGTTVQYNAIQYYSPAINFPIVRAVIFTVLQFGSFLDHITLKNT